MKSADGLSVKADEVLSGSIHKPFRAHHQRDATSGKITLKDLATKKMMTVSVTPNTSIRKMPAQMAQMFAARTQGGGQGGVEPWRVRWRPGRRRGAGRCRRRWCTGGPGGQGGAGGMRRAGSDLSSMLSRFPTESLSDLNKGDAIMVVATEPTPGATAVTAVTVLSGVEPILTANPNGGMDLSGWSMGQGPGGGGE